MKLAMPIGSSILNPPMVVQKKLLVKYPLQIEYNVKLLMKYTSDANMGKNLLQMYGCLDMDLIHY